MMLCAGLWLSCQNPEGASIQHSQLLASKDRPFSRAEEHSKLGSVNAVHALWCAMPRVRPSAKQSGGPNCNFNSKVSGRLSAADSSRVGSFGESKIDSGIPKAYPIRVPLRIVAPHVCNLIT